MTDTSSSHEILALDVGQVRIGLARASSTVRLAEPLQTLTVSETIYQDIAAICAERQVGQLVVGLPRNLNGQETAQTKAVQSFVEGLQAVVRLPIAWQDEAVTSRQAEAELNRRGKPYERGDIDALAACYILDDYLRTLGNGKL
jgi:putative Holliday junction resolvase